MGNNIPEWSGSLNSRSATNNWVQLRSTTVGTTTVQADSNGQFVVYGIPAGTYALWTGPSPVGGWTLQDNNYVISIPAKTTTASDFFALNPPTGDVQTWGRERYDVQASANSPRAVGDGAADDQPAIANARVAAAGKGIVFFPDPPIGYLTKRGTVLLDGDRLMGTEQLNLGVSGTGGCVVKGRSALSATLTTAPKVGNTSLVFTSDPSVNGLTAGDMVLLAGPVPEWVQVTAGYVSGTTVPLLNAVVQHGHTTSVNYGNNVFEFGGTAFANNISIEGLLIGQGFSGIYAPNGGNFITVRSCLIGNYFAAIQAQGFIQQFFLQDVFLNAGQYGFLEAMLQARDVPGNEVFDKNYFLNVHVNGNTVNGWNIGVRSGQSMSNNTFFGLKWVTSGQDAFVVSGGIQNMSFFNVNTETNCTAFTPTSVKSFTGTTGTNTGTVDNTSLLTTSGFRSFATIKGGAGNGYDFYGNIATIVSLTLTFQEPAPTFALTFQDAGAAATTLKAGTYTFQITYVNAAGETTAGPTATASLALDGNKFTVPAICGLPWLTGITSMKVYMITAPGGVTPGLVATRSLIAPNLNGNLGPLANSGATVVAFDITAGGASQTPPGANTANQNLGSSVTAVELSTAQFCDAQIVRGGSVQWIGANFLSGNARYGVDHRGGSGVMLGCLTNRPIYDPLQVVATPPGAGVSVRRPPNFLTEFFAESFFGGSAPETPRAQWASPSGLPIVIGLRDSNGNGSGTWAQVEVRRSDGNRSRLLKLDSTGRLYLGGASSTPASSNLNAHVASATVNASSRDQIGFVTITTDGTGVAAGQNLCRITFASPLEFAPNYVTLVDASTDTTLATVRFTAQNLSATVFDIFNTGGPLTASKSYIVSWKVEIVSA